MMNGTILEALGHPGERVGLGFCGDKLPQGHREHPLWKTVMRQCAPPVLGGWSQGLTPMERYMYLPIRLAGFGIAPESASRRFAQPNSLVSLMPRLLPARHQRREVLVPPELSKSSIRRVDRTYGQKYTFPWIRLLRCKPPTGSKAQYQPFITGIAPTKLA